MPVRKPSDRYCYAIQRRRYVSTITGRPESGAQVLHEFTRKEWREIEAMQGPVLDRYERISGYEAHKWVRSGAQHSTGLWTDYDGKIRYAESDPMMEGA